MAELLLIQSKYTGGVGMAVKSSKFGKTEKSETKTKESDVKPVLSNVDEIRKYKNLLDEDIITQEDFDVKKKQLLGLE